MANSAVVSYRPVRSSRSLGVMQTTARVSLLVFAVLVVILILVMWKRSDRKTAITELEQRFDGQIAINGEEFYLGCSGQNVKDLHEIAALAARVGELDILDLDVQIELADNQDILLVYENLQKGSRNHLRAFVRNLDMEGVTYQPQLLSEERYLAIINSEQETGLD